MDYPLNYTMANGAKIKDHLGTARTAAAGGGEEYEHQLAIEHKGIVARLRDRSAWLRAAVLSSR